MPSKHAVRNVQGEHRKNIVRLLESVNERFSRGRYDIFRDFVELSAISLANAMPPSKADFDRREARYFEIIERYKPETLSIFAQALGETRLAAEFERGDVLGDVFMGMDLASDARAQFFTPYDISRMIAEMMDIAGMVREQREKGASIITLHDPAIGAGGMMIAAVDSLRDHNVDHGGHLCVVGIDVDSRCCHMSMVQLAIRAIPAVIIHGNALSLEEWDRWYTPAYVAQEWQRAFTPEEQNLEGIVSRMKGAKQLDLFAMPEKKAS